MFKTENPRMDTTDTKFKEIAFTKFQVSATNFIWEKLQIRINEHIIPNMHRIVDTYYNFK